MIGEGFSFGRDRGPASGGLTAAIDIGATKAACLIARRGGGGHELIGCGFEETAAPSTSRDATVRLLRLALDAAEQAAGAAAPPAAAVYGGPGLKTTHASGAVALPGGVDEAAVRRALRKALDGATPSGRTMLHAAPLGYRVDDGPWLADPRGAKGRKLTAYAAIVTAPTAALAALAAAVAEADASLAGFLAGPLAAGHALLTEAERAAGAAVIELGATCANVGVFRAGALQWAETVGIGQIQATRALAERLGTTPAAAERVKRAFVSFASGAPAEAVPAPRLGPEGRLSPGSVRRGDLMEIVCGPLGETFAAARRVIERAGGAGLATLAGGGAEIPGIASFAEAALGIPVRVAAGAGGLGARATAAYGALALAETARGVRPAAPAERGTGPRARAHAARAWAWLRENF